MARDLRTSLIAVVVLTLLFGLAYPLAMTGVSQVVFPDKADGSRVERDGKVVGSRLIGQDFKGDPRFFQSRPRSPATTATAPSSTTSVPTARTCATCSRRT